MNIKFDHNNQISISLIKQIIKKLVKENNNYGYEIKKDMIKIIESLDCLYQKKEIQNFLDIKFEKYSKYINSLQNIMIKDYYIISILNLVQDLIVEIMLK